MVADTYCHYNRHLGRDKTTLVSQQEFNKNKQSMLSH